MIPPAPWIAKSKPGWSASGASERVAADGRVDERRPLGDERLATEAEPLRAAGQEVLDDDVGAQRESPHDVLAAGIAQVDRDAALAAVHAHEVRRLAAREGRAPGAGLVALAGPLDLDDLGAEVGQQHRAVRPRQHAGQVEDADAGERTGHLLGATSDQRRVPAGAGSPLQGLEHELRVLVRLHAAPDALELAVLVHQERRALDAPVLLAVVRLLDPRAVRLGGRVLRVGEERERQVVLRTELDVRGDVVGRDAVDLRARVDDVVPAIAQGAGLLSCTRACRRGGRSRGRPCGRAGPTARPRRRPGPGG